MSYNTDYYEENCIMHIDGTQDELIPGLNKMMARMAELYIENYMDPDYLDSIPADESILIDYTILSDEEMKELIECAALSLKLEDEDCRSNRFLS